MASMNLNFDTIELGTDINDVKVDPRLRVRVDTGIDFFNFVLSGDGSLQGLLPGGVYLFTGTPGAGKSTLALQLLDSLTGMGHTALLNACEESPAQVKMTVERLKLNNGFKLANAVFMDQPTAPKDLVTRVGDNVYRAHLEHAFKVHQKANKRRKDKSHMVNIIDSLQTMNDGKYGLGHNNKTPIRVLEELTQFSKENYVTTIVIGQVGKSGDFKGDNTLLHMVDGHIHLYIDQDPKSETEGCRIMEMRKNRFGPSGLTVLLDIGARGLREHSARGDVRGMRV